MSAKLILLRNGQSTWNLENRFTGWSDVDLSEAGLAESHQAGQQLERNPGSVPHRMVSRIRDDRTVDYAGHSHAEPFFGSRPGRYLLTGTLIVAGATLVLPYSPLSKVLGFTPLSLPLLLVLGTITRLYVLASELAKRVFYNRVQL